MPCTSALRTRRCMQCCIHGWLCPQLGGIEALILSGLSCLICIRCRLWQTLWQRSGKRIPFLLSSFINRLILRGVTLCPVNNCFPTLLGRGGHWLSTTVTWVSIHWNIKTFPSWHRNYPFFLRFIFSSLLLGFIIHSKSPNSHPATLRKSLENWRSLSSIRTSSSLYIHLYYRKMKACLFKPLFHRALLLAVQI